MDIILVIIGFVFLVIGIIGCVLPGLPGPPLAYISLVLLEFTSAEPFDSNFMILWATIVVVVTLFDYFVPIWGTKKFGGTKYGMWGSIIGLIIGIMTGPWGIVIGAFLGAYLGELIGGMRNENALRAGLGAFLGFVAGTIMKFAVSLIIGFYFFVELWHIVY